MSSVSEQDHINPRDPLYYAPRWLRDRSASRDDAPETPFSPASFDSQLESAVSDALRHPLDPQVMREPELARRRCGAWLHASAPPSAFRPSWRCSSSSSCRAPDRPTANHRHSPESPSRSGTPWSSPARPLRSLRSTNSRPFSPPPIRAIRRPRSHRDNCSSSSCSGARSRIRRRRRVQTSDPHGGHDNA